LKNLDDCDVAINKAWENMKKKVETSSTESLGYYDFKQHEPWFQEEY